MEKSEKRTPDVCCVPSTMDDYLGQSCASRARRDVLQVSFTHETMPMPRRMYLTTPRAAAVAGGLAFLILLIGRNHRGGAFGTPGESVRGRSSPSAFLPTWSGVQHALSADKKTVDELSDAASIAIVEPKDAPASPAVPAPLRLEGRVAGTGALPAFSDGSIGRDIDVSRMIVRNGGASIQVASVDSAMPRVRALAAQVGGYIANSTIQGGREQARTATLEIKAPAPAFDQLIGGLTPLGKVESVSVSAQDVGEEYVDVEARITNDHRLEARLIELLATRTGKLKDVLDVEQQLARIREEIERYEGRLRYLRAHAELSTLTITVHEPIPIINQVGTNPIVVAAREAWQNFVALIAFAIASLGVVVPVATVGGIAFLAMRRRPVTPTTVPGNQ
jgi:hypothetical protein